MGEHVVAPADELPPGERLIAELEGREVAVFNVDGEYVAYANYCAHQGGPLCEGRTVGTITASFDRETLETTETWVREGEILSCPWHGWEYDLRTGECLWRAGVSIPAYPVSVADGEIVVTI